MKNYKKPDAMKWKEGKVKGFFGKDLLSEKNGGLKMVKVAAKSSYPVHQHPDKTEFIYVLEGSPIITIGEKMTMGEKGDFFTLPVSINHSIENKTDIECLLLVGAIAL